jgi:hypothetical protein
MNLYHQNDELKIASFWILNEKIISYLSRTNDLNI